MHSLARFVFFLSGVAGLMFEIIWVRKLGLTIGATTLAVATTTAAYMGGLALGSYLGGRLADRLKRPLALYGTLEILIGLCGLAVPLLCDYVAIVDRIWFSDISSGEIRALIRFIIAILVLGIPTTAMGMTLPLLARSVTQKIKDVSHEVGILYGLNLAGAMLGSALAGFVFIPKLGLSDTNHLAVALDVLLGMGALLGGLWIKPLTPVAHATQGEPTQHGLQANSRKIVMALTVTGAAAMILQVLWTRAIGTAIGPSTYAFSSIVCTYLGGLMIGSFIASRVAKRIIYTRLTLAALLSITGAACLFGIMWVDNIPLLLKPIVLNPNLTMTDLIRTEFIMASLSVLPATIAMGAIFPLALSGIAGHHEKLGAAVGWAYALNTLGAIFGCFAGVFIFLPLLGVEWGMRIAALSYIVVAAYLIFNAEQECPRFAKYTIASATAAVALTLLAAPTWDIGVWTSGLYRLSLTRSYYGDSDYKSPRIAFHRDGMASTVTVEQEADTFWIKVNGKVDGSTRGDMPTQLLSGLLPMLIHPHPDEVAVIGCGTCVTIGSVLRANPKHATLIELEPAVIEGAKLFGEVNHEPWKDPRLTIAEDDGRNFFQRSRTNFDVIISEPSNPWIPGAASLFTQEFFNIAQTRLAPDGIFLQWLQIYELAPERIASLLKTFHQTFPHVAVFSADKQSNDLLLLGSQQPLPFEEQRLEARFAQLATLLEEANLTQISDLYALLLLTDKELDALPSSVSFNTDDNALVEFGAPQDLITYADDDPVLPFFTEQDGHHEAVLRSLFTTPPTNLPRFLNALSASYLGNGMIADSVNAAEVAMSYSDIKLSPELVRQLHETSDLANFFNEDDNERVIEPHTLETNSEYARAAVQLLDGEYSKALAIFKENPALQSGKPAVDLMYGYLLYKDEDYELAYEILQRARVTNKNTALEAALSYYIARIEYSSSEFAEAIEEMRSYRKIRESSSNKTAGVQLR